MIHQKIKTEKPLEIKNTYLVTGVAGFIGSWLCQALIKRNHRVIGIDNLLSGTLDNLLEIGNSDYLQFFRVDVCDGNRLNHSCNSIRLDGIFHVASLSSPFEFKRFPLEILKANLIGTFNVVELARKKDTMIIYASSSEVYGDPPDSAFPLSEDHVPRLDHLGDRGCYNEAKRAAETILINAAREYGLDVRICRIFNTYGPRMRHGFVHGKVIPNFITQALQGEPITIHGDGTQTRSFMYISDLIEGMLRFSDATELAGEIINLGNNHEISVLKLALLIKELTQSDSPIIFKPFPTKGDPRRRCPDIRKAKRLLNWEPRVPLNEGLIKTIAYYKKQLKSV